MHNIYKACIISMMVFTASCSGKREIFPVAALTPAKMIYVIEKDYPFGPGYYYHDELPEKTAYLTFDDGPSYWTAGILDTLAKENVKATFFVSGRWNMRGKTGTSFKNFKDVLLRMKHEGHIIANHTATHRTLTWMSAESIRSEILVNQKMLDDALGDDSVTMTIFRPPLGCPWLSRVSAEEKIRVADITGRYALTVLWTYGKDSTDAWDWAAGEWYWNSPHIDTKTAAFNLKKTRIYHRVVNGADGKGMVILFHDTHNTTAEVLPDIIEGLKEKDYVFGTAEDLLYWKYGVRSKELLSFIK
ncbi:MAG TPA: polysaccharide deacetylase family protein [Spirochaetota bacterium]|nr:polysaccharide deacetylase family protein [Spirochaetota bacterium]